MTSPRYYLHPKDRRVEALDRARRVSRWITAAAAASVVVGIGVVSREIPGRSPPATTTGPGATGAPSRSANSPAQPGSPTGQGHSAGQSTSGPAPTPQAPVVVSGGSAF